MRLNDLNPYSLNAQGWCEPTEARLAGYDRPGPPVDERAGRGRGGRSTLAAWIAALAQQPPKPVACHELWRRWSAHPRRSAVAALFPPVPGAAVAQSLRDEAASFVVRTVDDEGRPLADWLAASGLSAADVDVVLGLLVQLRHAWKTRAADVVDAGYDDLNWRHTCGELAQLLELARTGAAPAHVVVDAALASLLSDAAKLRGNFLVHHIDGAVAAFVVLPRVLPTTTTEQQARVVGICQAILEHQVGPPRFMATMVCHAVSAALRRIGLDVPRAAVVLEGLRAKIADPLNPAHAAQHDEGYGVLQLTPDERMLLRLVDLPEWYVPHPLTPWFATSSLVIDADSLVNYVTADGVGKIVAICGPGTPFADATVFHSMFSCGASFVDAISVMSDAAMSSVQRGLQATRTRIDQVRAVMAAEIERGAISFPQDVFDRIIGEESVDVGRLALRREGGAVLIDVGAPAQALPFWSRPLDYGDDGAPAHVARLLRRKVADLLRAT